MNGRLGFLKSVSDSGDSHSTGRDQSFSTDTIFEMLSNRRRRYVLHYLGQVEEPVTIRALSEQIAAWEHGVDRSEVTPKIRKRVYTALHQTHLPKMDQRGVVEYDTDRGVVELSDSVADFAIYLDVVAVEDVHWSHLYLSVGAVMTALVTLGGLGIWPFGAVGGFWYALLVALTVTGIGTYHTFRDQKQLIGSPTPGESVCAPTELQERLGK
jgi:hypothetical protein